MSKIQDCADLIITTMTFCDKENKNRNFSVMNGIFESMLIFLDYDDLIDIVKNRVIPNFQPNVNEYWFEYINGRLKYWDECDNEEKER